jgi:hypothetical protein
MNPDFSGNVNDAPITGKEMHLVMNVGAPGPVYLR